MNWSSVPQEVTECRREQPTCGAPAIEVKRGSDGVPRDEKWEQFVNYEGLEDDRRRTKRQNTLEKFKKDLENMDETRRQRLDNLDDRGQLNLDQEKREHQRFLDERKFEREMEIRRQGIEDLDLDQGRRTLERGRREKLDPNFDPEEEGRMAEMRRVMEEQADREALLDEMAGRDVMVPPDEIFLPMPASSFKERRPFQRTVLDRYEDSIPERALTLTPLKKTTRSPTPGPSRAQLRPRPSRN